MSDFYDVTASGMSVAECDEIALNNAGRVTSRGFGYGCPRGGDVNTEYESKVINTQGMGNHGTIILVGKTPRARELLRQGKIRALVAEGVREKVARVAIHEKYGMEVDVAKLADDLVEICQKSRFRGDSHRKFQEWSGIDDYGLSFPRVCAALRIAEKVAG